MDRKKLKSQIQELDEQLAVEFGLLKLDGRERYAAIHAFHPCGGSVALRWQERYSASSRQGVVAPWQWHVRV